MIFDEIIYLLKNAFFFISFRDCLYFFNVKFDYFGILLQKNLDVFEWSYNNPVILPILNFHLIICWNMVKFGFNKIFQFFECSASNAIHVNFLPILEFNEGSIIIHKYN